MNILLSLISSGAIKWLSILILVLGLVGGLYAKHRQIVDLEKQVALQQYNINQLQQNVKDNLDYAKRMEKISTDKSDLIANLYKEFDVLEEKLKKVESNIDVSVGKGEDRESSKILKDTFRELENMK